MGLTYEPDGTISDLHDSHAASSAQAWAIMGKSAESMSSNSSPVLSTSVSYTTVAHTPTTPSTHHSFAAHCEATTSSADGESTACNKDLTVSEWQTQYPQQCAYHDCRSLAAAWGLGWPVTEEEARSNKNTPCSAHAQHQLSEEDNGDGKANDIVDTCPFYRNEIGGEPIRQIALTRTTGTRPPFALNDIESWQREHTAAEVGVLEDVSNVYCGQKLCAERQKKIVVEPQDLGCYYYRHCFGGKAHSNYLGISDTHGPIAVSMIKDRMFDNSMNECHIFRLIVRVSDLVTLRFCVPEEVISETPNEHRSSRSTLRELLELFCPKVSFSCLKPAVSSQKVEELLMKIDETPMYTRYKIGVLLCKAGQQTEEEMYNNQKSSDAFDEFLDFLGRRVCLKDFDKYKGGLDTRGDTTGTHSLFADYAGNEIMFHVSTLLPFTPSNKQQLSRKRHIGNDMVTVIFQEPGSLPFKAVTMRSHFQHVFIIVRVDNACTEHVTYRVAVSRAKSVPAFGPAIPEGGRFTKNAKFRNFLLTKILNAENAVQRSKRFAYLTSRTRREALKDLADKYVQPPVNEGAAKLASRILGGSVRRRERLLPRPINEYCLRGAFSWVVEVQDHSTGQRVQCVLGISVDTLVLLEPPSGATIFATSTQSVLGWTIGDCGFKLYYDHGEIIVFRCLSNSDGDAESAALIKRLETVTNGAETKELMFKRSKSHSGFGFTIEDEGIVTSVEMGQLAWIAGLRQGSRVVEIDSQPVAILTKDQMSQILAEADSIRLLVIPQSPDGSPRRGCADPRCPVAKGVEPTPINDDGLPMGPVQYRDNYNPYASASSVDDSPRGAVPRNPSISSTKAYSLVAAQPSLHPKQVKFQKIRRSESDPSAVERVSRSLTNSSDPTVLRDQIDKLKTELSRMQIDYDELSRSREAQVQVLQSEFETYRSETERRLRELQRENELLKK
uniref:Rap-GAP domain-containing protein n=1 Tax=Steinernema glaseri TaxID=37863 RepID=A0A1I7Y376_9BILA